MRKLFKRHRNRLLLLAVVSVAALSLQSIGRNSLDNQRAGTASVTCADCEQILQLSGYTMGTTYGLQFVAKPDSLDQAALGNHVDGLLTHLDKKLFSTYAEDSELSRFNRSEVGEPFPVSAEFIEVMQLALEISQLSDGAFDVSIGPLVNLWGFGPLFRIADAVPKQAEIDALLANVGYDFIEIDAVNSQLIKHRAVSIDLSAIAKGYAVDVVAEYFDTLNIDNYFLEVGGELKIKGVKPGSRSWVPAIEKPVDTASQVYEIFYAKGEEIAVAGSGDYRNYFVEQGVHYSHEIDPRTGRPVTHNLAAVYVIDDTVARADAFATAYMILGLEKGRQLAQKLNQAVYFISKSGGDGFDEYFTKSFEKYLEE